MANEEKLLFSLNAFSLHDVAFGMFHTRGQEEIKAILIANFIHHSIKVVYVADEFYDGGKRMLLIIFNL